MGKRVNDDRLCTVPRCKRIYLAKGLCSMHYQRKRYNGDPNVVKVMKPQSFTTSERLKSHIADTPTPDYSDPRVLVTPRDGVCWVVNLTGAGTMKKYAQFSVKGRLRYAHRVAYEEWVGPIPEGLYIDHKCRTTKCINPQHLEPVTAKTNKNRGYTIQDRKETK